MNKYRIILLAVFAFGQALVAKGVCQVSLEPDKISPEICKNIDKNILVLGPSYVDWGDVGVYDAAAKTTINFEVLKATLSRIYQSPEVQTNFEQCSQFGKLIKSLCNPLFNVVSSFISNDRLIKKSSIARTRSDARLIPPPSGMKSTVPAATIFVPGSYCKVPGKTAITLTPKCGEIQKCESSEILSNVVDDA